MFTRLREFRIIPSLTVSSPEQALRLAEALSKAELPIMEITYRRHSDNRAIRAVKKEFPDFFIGATSILNRDLLLRVIDADADFAFAPGVNEETILEAEEQNFNFAPGVCSPTDIETALLLGLTNFQFYPCEAAGGLPMLEALIAPFAHLQVEFVPNGGIRPESLASYLAIPEVAAVAVNWLTPQEQVANENWAAIEKNILQLNR